METWRDELGLSDRGPYIAHYGRKGMKWGKNIFEENGQTQPSTEPKKTVEKGRLYNDATYAKYLPRTEYEPELNLIKEADKALADKSDPRSKSSVSIERKGLLDRLNTKLEKAYNTANGKNVEAHPEKAFKEKQMAPAKPTPKSDVDPKTLTSKPAPPKQTPSVDKKSVGKAISDLFSGIGSKAVSVYVDTPMTILDEGGKTTMAVAGATTEATKNAAEDAVQIGKNVGDAAVAASKEGVSITESSAGAISDIAATVKEITGFARESIKRLFGNLNHDGVETDEHIEHWGIKSMKWGERRFRNYDGTLTPEGKARYYKRYGRTLESMTTEEIKAASDRVRAEQEYISLVDRNYAIEKETEKQARDRIKDTIGIAASAGALILTAIKIKDALSGKPVKDGKK